MNLWDILILLIIGGCICLTYYLKRQRMKKGNAGCCGSCQNCNRRGNR